MSGCPDLSNRQAREANRAALSACSRTIHWFEKASPPGSDRVMYCCHDCRGWVTASAYRWYRRGVVGGRAEVYERFRVGIGGGMVDHGPAPERAA